MNGSFLPYNSSIQKTVLLPFEKGQINGPFDMACISRTIILLKHHLKGYFSLHAILLYFLTYHALTMHHNNDIPVSGLGSHISILESADMTRCSQFLLYSLQKMIVSRIMVCTVDVNAPKGAFFPTETNIASFFAHCPKNLQFGDISMACSSSCSSSCSAMKACL